MAAKDYELSKAICEAIKSYDPEIIVMGLSGSEMIRAAKDLGLKAASEVFADRAYEEDGTLVNRRKEGAVIKDENEAIARRDPHGKRAESYNNHRKRYFHSG